MKHPNDNIDQFLKNQLSKVEVDLPDQTAFWDRIDPNKPKRRRPIVLWALLGFIGFIAFLWMKQGSTTVQSEDEKSEVITGISPLPETEITPAVDISTKANMDSEQPLVKELDGDTGKSKSHQQLEKKGQQQPIADRKSSTSSKKRKESNAIASQKQRDAKRLVGEFSSNTTTTEAVIDMSPIWKSMSSESTIDENAPKPPPTKAMVSSSAALPLWTPTEIAYERIPFLNPPSLVSWVPSLATASVDQLSWYWQIQLEAGLVTDKVGLTDESLSFEFSQNYGRHVDPLASYQVQLVLGARLTDRSSISIGLEYQHVEKQHSIVTESLTLEKVWNEEALVSNGQFIADSSTTTVITSISERKPIRETFINLPVNYYHDVVKKGNVSVGLKAGLIINLSRYLTGPQLSRTNQWADVSRQRQTTLGLSYELGVEAAYQITTNNQFYLTPKFRCSPSNHVNEKVNFTLQKSVLSLEFGFRSGF